MKPTFLILLFCTLLSACSNGQAKKNTEPNPSPANPANQYEAWKEEAESNIRLYPKYGGFEKTQDHLDADQALIETSTRQEGTRLKASEAFVRTGFEYLYKGDLKTAMYRFNQAWLLEPKNENVFWGFAAVYFNLGDLDMAMKQLDEGLILNPKSANIITDQATIHVERFQRHNDPKDLSTAIKLFEKSYAIDPKNQNTLFKLSALYFMKKDCKNALKYYKECKALGGQPLTPAYIQAIENECGKE